MKRTQWPQERIRNERLDREAERLRQKQRTHKSLVPKTNPDPRGRLLHDGLLEKKDMPYLAYLRTRHWRIVKEAALKFANNQCSTCGSSHRLCVHHLTYDNLWHEYEHDVTVLCDTCHNMLHGQYIYPV